jgi:hypothetical protein
MNHRHHLKATIWILVNRPFFLTRYPSAAAFRLQGPRFPLKSPIPSFSSWPSLQATSDSGETSDHGTKSKNMIVRVRSNLGTAKLAIEEGEKATQSSLRKGFLEELKRQTSNVYNLTQDLSFDPAGARRIHLSKTLGEQGIGHGCMVYCRVEEEIPDHLNVRSNSEASVDNAVLPSGKSKAKRNVEVAGKKETIAKKNDDVIDLIDSSDEEESVCISNKVTNDDDDDVQVISPPKKESNRRGNAVDNTTTKARKRQRSDAHSGLTKAAAGENNNGRRNYPNFQIASYNVWFGPPDAEAKQVFPKQRMAGIVESLRMAYESIEREEGEACPLLFVGLQELTANLVHHLQPKFQSIGYRLCTQPIGGFGPSYGVGIAVPDDLTVLERQFVPYRNSVQGRGFLFVRTPTILFVTTHLESWCGPQFTGSQEREVQIVEAAQFCRQQLQSVDGLELAVIAGDLNWDDERKRKQSEAPNRNLLSILPDGWNDAGTPFDYTYDAKENPMLNGNLRRRFDRCIYLSRPKGEGPQGRNYKSIGLQKIGKESIPDLVWNKKNPYNDTIKIMAVNPSDHFGIMTHFSKKAS